MSISVIGLGKLGLCSAACFALKGFEVIGVDINKDLVDAINNGIAPFYEPKLQELITSVKEKLKSTQDYKEAITKSDITFIIIPTPSRQDGNLSDEYIKEVLKHLSLALKEANKRYHLFVITSTVSPGTVDGNIIPLIESVSGKRINQDFGLCYNPEFIALGSVINDFLNPDLVLIGESDKVAGDKLEKIYKIVCENKPYIARMSLVSAEITKLSLNSYITMKISFANTLANICEAIPGANIDDVTRALGADKRVSPYYLKGGPSFGGPCFPRDNRAFVAFAKKYGSDAMLIKTTDAVNMRQIGHIVDRVLSCLSDSDNKAVSVLGLAYKPSTPIIEESLGVRIIQELLKKTDSRIVAYDPLAMDNARAHFAEQILYASSVKDCLSYSPLCIITTQDDEFRSIDDSFIIHNPTTIIDCWRLIDPSRFGGKVKYIALGRGET
ncbi:MAG: nucleotide sugar dehydrogenase [Thermodesulfobacteriota bacterium]